jgi:hypothetical protein
LELTSYPKSLGKNGRFINDKQFMSMLKNSTIFTYGIYRQIIAEEDLGTDGI